MCSLVDGTAATSEVAYHPGQSVPSVHDTSDTDDDDDVSRVSHLV